MAGNQITVTATGFYSIEFSLTLLKASGGPIQVSFWLSLNGSDVINSREDVSLTNSAIGTYANLNYGIQLNAGGSLQILWSASNAGTVLQPSPAAVAPPRPAIPSARITMTQIR